MIDKVTVLMPTSSSPLHPDTSIIEAAVGSIRAQPHIGGCRVIVMADGIAPQHEYRRAAYEEYLDRLRRLVETWVNVEIREHDVHSHQVNMTRAALAVVETPLVLFVEHDWVLAGRPDPAPGLGVVTPIDWPSVIFAVESGVGVMRFMWEPQITPWMADSMIDTTPVKVGGHPVLRTIEWSQRPHLATTAMYRWILNDFWPSTEPRMIEDAIFGLVVGRCQRDPAAWDQWRICIDAAGWPGNLSRIEHLDGRRNEPVFDPDWEPT